MHQPYYKGPEQSDYHLPWVYLHGIKDYSDMAAHLEHNPEARAVVNFAPVLLEQIDDYAGQIEAWLNHGEIIRDPVLAALAGPQLPTGDEARKELIAACLRANERHLIHRFKLFAKLAAYARPHMEDDTMISYLGDQFIVDLLVWYHLAWVGECTRRQDMRVHALESKGMLFNLDDRKLLVELIGEVLQGLTSRYKVLAKDGRVELSVTPYAHPIMPLLLDMNSAREAMPDIQMPELTHYPEGAPRVRWHLEKGLEVFEKHFGFRPQGCWPSEGAVSEATVRLLEDSGFKWAATGQQVLRNSLHASGHEHLPDNWVHTPYRVQDGGLNIFFRDDGLSDLIGFTYGDWHSEDAVGDLLNHLDNIANACANNPNAVASIIMDGENAWEYYPNNASYFLETLYRRLVEHPRLQLTTFSEALEEQWQPAPSLSRLVAGSWVYGTFSTWIGDRDKNRAWDMLVEAKAVYDRVVAERDFSAEQRDELERQLAICEGSDWFWWFGEYNPSDSVSDFEKLFRRQLAHLYELLDEPEPEYLSHVFAVGGGDPSQGGAMRKN
jgi:alpha-amylase/alpha-mannosidase (GH57 family)